MSDTPKVALMIETAREYGIIFTHKHANLRTPTSVVAPGQLDYNRRGLNQPAGEP